MKAKQKLAYYKLKMNKYTQRKNEKRINGLEKLIPESELYSS